MNNDENVDIIGISENSVGINILYNNGDGKFFDKIFIRTDNPLIRIDVGYINQDNQLDIIFLTNEIRILFNTGNGEYNNEMTYETDDVPIRLKLTDINQDKISDLIIGYKNNFKR
jgi:hypothetical protein